MQCSALFLPFSDLGVHVDGFIANVAHTFVIGVAQVGSMLFSFVVLGRGMLPFGFSSPL